MRHGPEWIPDGGDAVRHGLRGRRLRRLHLQHRRAHLRRVHLPGSRHPDRHDEGAVRRGVQRHLRFMQPWQHPQQPVS